MLIRERNRGVSPHEGQGKLFAGSGTGDGWKGRSDLFKPSKDGLGRCFPHLGGSKVGFTSGGRGVGSNDVPRGLICNMIANKVRRIFSVIKVPQRAVSLNFDVGSPMDIVGVGLEVAPQNVPFPISRDRAPCSKVGQPG
jgi:hypothetical protein